MTKKNAERLQQIDDDKEFNMCGITGKLLSIELSNRDYSFLYTEAERVKELEEKVAIKHEAFMLGIKETTEYAVLAERYREALSDIIECSDIETAVQEIALQALEVQE